MRLREERLIIALGLNDSFFFGGGGGGGALKVSQSSLNILYFAGCPKQTTIQSKRSLEISSWKTFSLEHSMK